MIHLDILILLLLKNVRQPTISTSLPVQWGYTAFLTAANEGHAGVTRFLLQSGSVFHEKTSVSAVRPVWVHVVFYCG